MTNVATPTPPTRSLARLWFLPVTTLLLAIAAPPAAAESGRVAYFFWADGEFAAVRLDTQRVVARWMLPRVAGVSAWVGPFGKPHESWLPGTWTYDDTRERLYGFVQTGGFSDDDATPAVYAVVALDPPLLEPVKRFGTFAEASEPSLVVSRDGAKLAVAYLTSPQDRGEQTTIEVFDAETGRRLALGSVDGRGWAVGMTADGKWVYVATPGSWRRVATDGEPAVVEAVSARELLDAPSLDAAVKAAGGTRDLRPFSFGGGRVALGVGPSLLSTEILVADGETRTLVSPLVRAPSRFMGGLSPDGEILFMYGFVDSTLSGDFWVFDAGTGALLKRFSAPELSGSLDRVDELCESSTGARIVRVADPYRLFWIDPRAEKPVVPLAPSGMYVGPETTCVIVDEASQ